jgi:RNA polymerase sigma-70 factor, ECF subfamily
MATATDESTDHAGQRPSSAGRAFELTEASDGDLALALIDAHPAAPRVAWSRFSPMVRRILRRILGPGSDVEDLTQEVFLRLFQQVPTIRDPIAFRAFVIAITVRAAQHQLRQARILRDKISSDAELMAKLQGNSDVESEYAVIRFYQVLDRLRKRDRTAFVLRFIEGMQLDDIAETLRTSRPTVQRCLVRAQQRVRLLAERDAFLTDYVCKRHTGSPPSSLAAAAIPSFVPDLDAFERTRATPG